MFFFQNKLEGSFQFWEGGHKVKQLFKIGAVYWVNNGQGVFFWEDAWITDVPLKILF